MLSMLSTRYCVALHGVLKSPAVALACYSSSAEVGFGDKSFGGKSIKDKPQKAVVAPKEKRSRSADAQESLEASRKQREQAKKEIRAKQLEIQKKRELVKTKKAMGGKKPSRTAADDEDD